MTTTATIKCGNCKGRHSTAAEVRVCYGSGAAVPTTQPLTTPKAVAATAAKPATEKQREFIRRLATERGVAILSPSHNADYDINPLGPVVYVNLDTVSSKGASQTIEQLLAMPKSQPVTHPDNAKSSGAVPEGMHMLDDTIYKVQVAVHGSGHLYAKRLVPGEGYGAKAKFVYAPGALKLLSSATKMTIEKAKAFGALYGTCCVCGRTLTNEDSIEAGIGPVCAGKADWFA